MRSHGGLIVTTPVPHALMLDHRCMFGRRTSIYMYFYNQIGYDNKSQRQSRSKRHAHDSNYRVYPLR